MARDLLPVFLASLYVSVNPPPIDDGASIPAREAKTKRADRKKRYGRIAGSGRNEERRGRESKMTGPYLPIVSISASIDFCCSSVIQVFSRRIIPKSPCV